MLAAQPGRAVIPSGQRFIAMSSYEVTGIDRVAVRVLGPDGNERTLLLRVGGTVDLPAGVPVARVQAKTKAKGAKKKASPSTSDKEAAERAAKAKAERETKVKAERESKAKAKAKAEREAKATAERKAKAKAEREAKAKAEERKAKADREAKAKAERDAKAKAEREAKAKAEREAEVKAEEREAKETKAKSDREAKAKAEREAKAERKAKAERETKAKAEEADREPKPVKLSAVWAKTEAKSRAKTDAKKDRDASPKESEPDKKTGATISGAPRSARRTAIDRAYDWFKKGDDWPNVIETLDSIRKSDVERDEIIARMEVAFRSDTRRAFPIVVEDTVWLPDAAVDDRRILIDSAGGPFESEVSPAGPDAATLDVDNETRPRQAFKRPSLLGPDDRIYLHKSYYRRGDTDFRNKDFDYIQHGWRRIKNLARMLPAGNTLVWHDVPGRDAQRPIRVAPYKDGAFKIIEAGGTYVLFYEWSDGSFRDFEGGEREYLEWKANHWLTNPVQGFDSFDEFLEAAKSDTTGALRADASSQEGLEWRKTTAGESIVHHAVLARRGAFEVRRPRKNDDYTLFFLPLEGKEQRLGTFGKSPSKAKEKAIDVAVALVSGRGKTTRTEQLTDAVLEWTEEPGGERRVCIAVAPDGGEFQVIELKNGAFALYYLHSLENWDQLGCGECEQLKKKAETIVKSRRPSTPKRQAKKQDKSKKQEKKPDKTDSSLSEEEKVAAAMGGLKDVVGDLLGELGIS